MFVLKSTLKTSPVNYDLYIFTYNKYTGFFYSKKRPIVCSQFITIGILQ